MASDRGADPSRSRATAMPSHETEVIMLIAPSSTNSGGTPNSNSARMPTGMEHTGERQPHRLDNQVHAVLGRVLCRLRGIPFELHRKLNGVRSQRIRPDALRLTRGGRATLILLALTIKRPPSGAAAG